MSSHSVYLYIQCIVPLISEIGICSLGWAELGLLMRFSTKFSQGWCPWGRGVCQAAQEVLIAASAEDQQGWVLLARRH